MRLKTSIFFCTKQKRAVPTSYTPHLTGYLATGYGCQYLADLYTWSTQHVCHRKHPL